jgi:uncharacterized protein YbgA (DUF1722 family)
MGKIVAAGKGLPKDELFAQYERLLIEALKLKSTRRKNIKVLQHMMGYFKEEITTDEKQEILELLDAYREGYIPLTVPVTLMNHYVRKYRQTYLQEQVYLNPHPVELQLRNHA